MLDFYLIKDDQITPDSPTELEFIGQLDSKTFKNLKTKGIIENHYEYNSDFRWKSEQIKQICQNNTDHKQQNDTDVKQLFKIIEIIENTNSGIIAFGD